MMRSTARKVNTTNSSEPLLAPQIIDISREIFSKKLPLFRSLGLGGLWHPRGHQRGTDHHSAQLELTLIGTHRDLQLLAGPLPGLTPAERPIGLAVARVSLVLSPDHFSGHQILSGQTHHTPLDLLLLVI